MASHSNSTQNQLSPTIRNPWVYDYLLQSKLPQHWNKIGESYQFIRSSILTFVSIFLNHAKVISM
ncbi:hypothetical protein HDU76_001634, partial [Blyttiomyces sp. JEL0837]